MCTDMEYEYHISINYLLHFEIQWYSVYQFTVFDKFSNSYYKLFHKHIFKSAEQIYLN